MMLEQKDDAIVFISKSSDFIFCQTIVIILSKKTSFFSAAAAVSWLQATTVQLLLLLMAVIFRTTLETTTTSWWWILLFRFYSRITFAWLASNDQSRNLAFVSHGNGGGGDGTGSLKGQQATTNELKIRQIYNEYLIISSLMWLGCNLHTFPNLNKALDTK